jgi:hypothetical protein
MAGGTADSGLEGKRSGTSVPSVLKAGDTADEGLKGNGEVREPVPRERKVFSEGSQRS